MSGWGGITPEDGLRDEVSLPVATVISGMDSLEVLRKNIAVVDDFVPLGGGEIDAWRRVR